MTEYTPSAARDIAESDHRIDIVLSGGADSNRIESDLAASGLRRGGIYRVGEVGMDELGKRPIWVELTRDEGKSLDRWLIAFNAFTDAAQLPAAIAMEPELVDIVSAEVEGHVDLLVTPNALERASALAVLSAQWNGGRAIVADSGRDEREQLLRLTEEVQRIAATLSEMSERTIEAPAVSVEAIEERGEGGSLSVETVRSMIRARRLREEFFDKSLFGDPAWDMMLDLLAAEIAQHRVPVSSLCMAAAVPPTTALRWIKNLTDRGLFLRRPDPRDGRRVFIELAEPTSRAMRAYFARLEGRVAA